jgi:hypothetical protein
VHHAVLHELVAAAEKDVNMSITGAHMIRTVTQYCIYYRPNYSTPKIINTIETIIQ